MRVVRPLAPVTLEQLQQIGSWTVALDESKKPCGLQAKSICIEVGIDPGSYSKIMSGQAGIKWEDFDKAMDVWGSELALFWMLFQRGWDPTTLRRLESDVEKENRELKELLAHMQRENEWIEKFVRSIVHVPDGGAKQPVALGFRQ